MRIPHSIEPGDRPATFIHIGGMFASAEPYLIRTILGSCVAVCLRDPKAKIGGMNHFMLPRRLGSHGNPASYGVHAMELLINQLMLLGARRDRLEAKVVGGGHVLKIVRGPINIPTANVHFALDFLEEEGIRVVKRDIGGYAGREVFFFTDSGRLMVRRMAETGIDRSEMTYYDVVTHRDQVAADADENVTLFT